MHDSINIHIRNFQNQIDYIIARNKDGNRVRNIKAVFGEEVAQ